MPCPTCDRTLQLVGNTDDGRRHWWCPSCGTLRSEAGKHADTEPPRIVYAARVLLDALGSVGELPGLVGAVRNLREAATGRAE